MNPLHLQDQGTILLPDWIGGSTLTLAEIGAIACFHSFQSASEVPEVAARISSPEMAEAIKSLGQKGILQLTQSGNRVSIEIDLDPTAPPSITLG